MKIRHPCLVIALCFLFMVAGCQTASLYSQPGTVAENDLVSIAGDTGARTWNGRNIAVDYTYSRKAGQMDLSGTVRFAGNLTNGYNVLHDFHLSAIFTDENGRVLETKGLTTDRGDFSPVPFHVTLVVPASAVAMSFSYQGTAAGGGGSDGDGTFGFWQIPVH